MRPLVSVHREKHLQASRLQDGICSRDTRGVEELRAEPKGTVTRWCVLEAHTHGQSTESLKSSVFGEQPEYLEMPSVAGSVGA